MKKIYFAGSIRGGRGDAELYKKMIDELKHYGTVLTEHIGSQGLFSDKSDHEIHEQDIKWLAESDFLIAEVTTPSLGVGYEIGHAVAMEKPVICLYRGLGEAPLSAMIAGSPGIICHKYGDFEEARKILKSVFTENHEATQKVNQHRNKP